MRKVVIKISQGSVVTQYKPC